MPPRFLVRGGRPLRGTVRPAGNKNAALPILAATVLADGVVELDNVPRIRDVETMLAVLLDLGAQAEWTAPNSLKIDTRPLRPKPLDPALCAKIRASILLAGPLLARCGEVKLPPPGGDVIGRRRLDTHFLALEQLGASVDVGDSFELRGEGARRRRRLPRRAERHRHRERAHGRGRRQGHDGAAQRRLRAARAGPRALPRRHGRADRGHRHEHLHDPRRPAARRRHATHRSRSHRGRLASSASPPSPTAKSASTGAGVEHLRSTLHGLRAARHPCRDRGQPTSS